MKKYILLLTCLGMTSSLLAYSSPEDIKLIQSGDGFALNSDIIFDRHTDTLVLSERSSTFESSEGALTVKFQCQLIRTEAESSLTFKSCLGYPKSRITKDKYKEVLYSKVDNRISKKGETIYWDGKYYYGSGGKGFYGLSNYLHIITTQEKNGCLYKLIFKCENNLGSEIVKLPIDSEKKGALFEQLFQGVSHFQLQEAAKLIRVKFNSEPATEWP
jgi:hypothetical protein